MLLPPLRFPPNSLAVTSSNRTPAHETSAGAAVDSSPQAASIDVALPEALTGQDWRARVVCGLVLRAPSHWGPVSSAIAFALLDRRDDLYDPVEQHGLYRLAGMMGAAGFVLHEGDAAGVQELLYEDGRFGIRVRREAQVEVRWACGDLPCDGFWHAVLAAVVATEVEDIDPSLLSTLPGLLARLVAEDPGFAVAAWQSHLAGDLPAFTPDATATLGDVAWRCGSWMAVAAGAAVGLTYGFASDALHSSAVTASDGALRPSTELIGAETSGRRGGNAVLGAVAPLAGAFACGALELRAAARLYAAVPSERAAVALHRAQHLSAYALLLPSLTADELRLLMSTLGEMFAEIDVFDVAETVQFRLSERPTPMTPRGVISRIKWQKLRRKARQREQSRFHFAAPGWVTVLESALQLAQGANLLTPFGNVVQEAHAQRRRARWNAECDALDAQALANAPRRLPAFAGKPPPVATRPGGNRSSHVVESAERATSATSATSATGRGGPDSSPWLVTAASQAATASLSPSAWRRRWLPVTGALSLGAIGSLVMWSRFRSGSDLAESTAVDADAPRRPTRELRPFHHLAPQREGMELDQTAEPETLEEMLNVIDATDAIEASANVMEKHRSQALTVIEKQMEAVLRKQGKGAADLGYRTALPWSAEVEVTYSKAGRSPDTRGFTFSFSEEYETKRVTVRDIAIGTHYSDEYEITGGYKRVASLRVLDNEAHSLLMAVNRDDFRTQLQKRDERQLRALEASGELMSEYARYVQEVFTGVLFNATSFDWERQTPPGSRAGTSMLAPHPQTVGTRSRVRVGRGPVRLISFDGEILADLLSVQQPDGDAVLLISIKHATYFWWWPGVEATLEFQEFVSLHMSPIDLQRLESPLRRSRMRYQIDPGSVKSHWACASSNREVGETATTPPPRGPFDALYDEVSLKPYFKFETCPSLHLALWTAKVRRAHSDRDLVIVTQKVRDERRLNSVQHIVLNYVKLLGPAMIAAFKSKGRIASAIMTLAFEVGPYFGTYALLAERAKSADLEELKRIHREMSVSYSVAMMLRALNSPTLDAIADTIVGDRESTRIASQHLRTFMAAWPLVSEQRKQFADDVRGIVRGERREDALNRQPVWTIFTRIKAYRNLLTDGAQTEPMTADEQHVDRFLGAGRKQVTTQRELMRLPEGYCVALTYPDGTMFFAAVTSGSGKLLGAATDDGEGTIMRRAKLPIHRMERISQDAIVFLDDGRVTCGAIEARMYVEPLRDRVPPWRQPEQSANGIWPRVPTLPPLSTSTPASPELASNRAPVIGAGSASPVGRSKRALDRWETFMNAWYVRAGRIVPGESLTGTPSNRAALPLPVASVSPMPSTPSTLSTPVSLVSPSVGTPTPPPAAMAAYWTAPTFRRAFGEVVSRVTRGLLLWHLQASPIAQSAPTAQQRLMLRALQDNLTFLPVTVNTVRLPGVVGTIGDEGCLLLSLTTCEAITVSVEGEGVGTSTPRVPAEESEPLRRFVGMHVAEDIVERLRGQTMSVALDGAQESDSPEDNRDTHRIIDDLRDRVERATQRGHTVDGGILRLITPAMRTLSGVDAEAFTAGIRGVTREVPNRASDVVYLNEPVDGPQIAPSVELAYDLGTAIREFADDVFPRASSDTSLADAIVFVTRFVDPVQQCRILTRVSNDVASLIESGMGDTEFVAAMLAAGRGLGDGKFGAAFASMWEQVPGQIGACVRQATVPQLVRLRGTRMLQQVPRGHRILARPASADAAAEGGYDDMLSLGEGRVAVVSHVGTELAPRFNLTSVDLTRVDGDIVWSEDVGAWRRDGHHFDFWIQSDTPGVFADPIRQALETGSLNPATLRGALLAHSSLTALQAERAGASEWVLGDTTTRMLDASADIFTGYGFTDLRYRLIVAWSEPDQFKPALSLALVGTGVGETFRSWATSGYVDRVVADLLPRRTLGSAPQLTDDICVASEVDWAYFYEEHSATRCIKYVDFDTADAALAAARAYTTVPGMLPSDFIPGGTLLRVPVWSSVSVWAP
ncbi:hypothetical protein LXM60_06770 [Pandoraea sputorum]|uniref:hypothetical protein n=1 Tax=Pandoraea sputorum TaxID=93222 RepID=UPI001E504F56|nr:hypothetical protein [Pandoraea sputorum]MCE4059909.1 hypothetical protein [Pandoraea sputorum]